MLVIAKVMPFLLSSSGMTAPIYNKNHPFIASVKERYSLSKPGSDKSTMHVVLDLKGSGIRYAVGDSVAVAPKNDKEIVNKVLKAINATGKEVVSDRHNENIYSLEEYLEIKADLADVPKKMIAFFAGAQTDPDKKKALEALVAEGAREKLKQFQESREVWDFLEENREVILSPQELVQLLQPQLPRFYSIASSQAVVGDEVHLTVAELIYKTNNILRRGICTHYLCRLAPMHGKEVPVYVQPSNGFGLPTDPNASLIMIGPGTGVAPYRAFMQERMARGDTGQNWLFFGERYGDKMFFYEEEWKKTPLLRVDTAFSRDQGYKIYVQDRLLEHGAEVYAWIKKGAYVFVCGDAKRMAKDVDAALHTIVQTHGHCTEKEAAEYIKALRKEGRYLRDVY
jgi:sulfite reductase (NADPH) flavoprotein alpha-component